jgi:UDP-N-acetylglucosamine 2-epimerase (non-hydrolysing)
MKILHVVGARPNFPKLAPVYQAAAKIGIEQVILHTGQHYDDALSAGFFRDLEIPSPDINLEIGSGSHAQQTARIMERVEPVMLDIRPDWLVVYGDVNSTLASAIVASKVGIRIAHVEAGLRSFDRTMPEEINRILTDRIADLLLAPSIDAVATLRAEGESRSKIYLAGNVMIDTLLASLPKAINTGYTNRVGALGDHLVVTLHRPSNVDNPERLSLVMRALVDIAVNRPVFFPAHPRTRQRLKNLSIPTGSVNVTEPIAYFEMLDLVRTAHAVITDSGGLQEETTALGVPCFTLRSNTERPITLTEGTNQLVNDISSLSRLVSRASRTSSSQQPVGWDGKAGERIAHELLKRQ